MAWTLFYFLLACAYLADAQTGERCNPKTDVIRVDAEDCQQYWLCARTSITITEWVAARCEDGFIADVNAGCVEGMCYEPPPPPPVGPSDTFDCAAAGAAWGTRGFGDPLDCRYYWWCWVVNGEWAPKVYKCPEGQMWKQHGESCWSGPCMYA